MFYDSIKNNYNDPECAKRCCCFHLTNSIIRYFTDAAILALFITVCVFLKTNQYGEDAFSPIYSYAIGALVLHIFWMSISFYIPWMDLNSATQIAGFLFSLISIVFVIVGITYTTDSYARELTDVAFANWNVAIEFMSFQSNHGCDGLKALNSTCEMCCDEDYYNAVTDNLNE